MWWFTIMAPSEVMAMVDRVWHVLETRASWSLLHSLSRCHSSRHMDRQSSQVSVTTHQAPLAITVPVTTSSSAEYLHNSSVGSSGSPKPWGVCAPPDSIGYRRDNSSLIPRSSQEHFRSSPNLCCFQDSHCSPISPNNYPQSQTFFP